MEVVEQWSGVAITVEEEEEDVSLQRKQFQQNSNNMKTGEDGLPVQLLHRAESINDAEDTGSSCESSQSESPNFQISKLVPVDVTLKIEIESSDILNEAVKHYDEEMLPPPYIEQDVAKDSFSIGGGIIKNCEVEVREEIEKEVGELYLETVYKKPGSHRFYCPSCDACISKVIIKEIESQPVAVEPPFDLCTMFRCTSCFSFLVPIGNWFLPKPPPVKDPVEPEIPAPEGPVVIPIISGRPPPPTLVPSRESKRWQILKSIVYGGLAESITSLGIVTSAASSDTKTVNIVVLALANLIGGLFVIGNNLRSLKNDKFQKSKGETEEQVDRYGEALGEREHIALHFTIVILSFIVFGLIPPLVYGLSFRVSDNRDFKLAAVAAASLVCISLLALGKAHIQGASGWKKYIAVVSYYLGIGIGVSGLSYLAGDLIGKLFDKFGWFKASSGDALVLPGTGFSELGFRSY